MACSLTVGVLWGANIGTLYPFVQIVFRGESLQQSVSQTLAEAETRSQELQAGIDRLRSRLAGAPPDLRTQLQRQIDWQQTRLDAERRVIRSTRAYQPYLDGLLPRDPFLTLVVVIAAMAAGTLLKSLALVGSEVLVARAVHGAVFDIQNEFYRRTLRMDLATFGEDRASVLVSCFTHRIQALTAALNALFGQAVREPLKMTACLIGAALISWRLLVLSLLIAPLGILLLRLLTKSIRRGCRDDMNLVTALYQRVSESFQGILAIKAFTAEQREQARFRETTSRMLRQRKRLAFFLALTKPVSEVMGIGIISVAILASSYLVLHRETHLFGFRISDQPLSPAALMVFYGLLAGVADPARRLGDIYTRLFLGLAAAERVFRLMDREPQIKDPPQPRPLPEGWQGLAFDGVHFAYRPSEPVLRGVELRVARRTARPGGPQRLWKKHPGQAPRTVVRSQPRRRASGWNRSEGIPTS